MKILEDFRPPPCSRLFLNKDREKSFIFDFLIHVVKATFLPFEEEEEEVNASLMLCCWPRFVVNPVCLVPREGLLMPTRGLLPPSILLPPWLQKGGGKNN